MCNADRISSPSIESHRVGVVKRFSVSRKIVLAACQNALALSSESLRDLHADLPRALFGSSSAHLWLTKHENEPSQLTASELGLSQSLMLLPNLARPLQPPDLFSQSLSDLLIFPSSALTFIPHSYARPSTPAQVQATLSHGERLCCTRSVTLTILVISHAENDR